MVPPSTQVPRPQVNPWGSLADVAGVLVGHTTRTDGGHLTGCTVVVPPPGTVGGVDVAGGGPATCETDALAPGTVTGRVDAVLLTGGSAFGLAAVAGVHRWCEEQGRGFDVGVGVVPVVPTLALFDLGRGGDVTARPGPDDAAAAAAVAGGAAVPTGNVGAGTGALCAAGSLAGGVGTASVRLPGGVTVGALVAVNAAGTPVDAADGRLLAATAFPPGLVRLPAPDPAEHRAAAVGATAAPPRNTTLVVVATDASLDGAGCTRLAAAAQAGLARSLDPVATLADGDAVVALATGARPVADAAPTGADARSWPGAADRMGTVAVQAAAATATAVAVADAVLSARTLRTAAAGEVPSYRERYPSLGRWSPG